MLWLVLAVMSAVAVALLLAPLLRATSDQASRGAHGLEVYRDQLREVERDLERGLVSSEEAAGLRLEVERRMLGAAEDGAATRLSVRWRRLSAAGLGLGLPLAAAALYLWLGSPETPSRPFVERAALPEAQPDTLGPRPGDIEPLAERLKARLEREPGSLADWLLLARSYWELDRFQEAAAAFRRAAELEPGDADILMGLGESLVMVAQGVVTPEAVAAFEKALAERPDHPGARFYLALAQAQAGRTREAFERWLVLAAETPAEAPWRALLLERLGVAADELGVELAEVLPEAPSPIAPAEPVPGPTRAEMEAAAEMSAEEREAMIRGMVARLAERMERTPQDAEGWMRLGRAYRVLGETAEAREAYARAAALEPDDVGVLVAYAATIVEAAKGTPVPEKAARLFRRVLELEPENRDALWFLGLAELEAGRRQAALAFWRRLLATVDPTSPQYADLSRRIEALERTP